MSVVRIGLECFVDQPPRLFRKMRFALLMNQASLDSRFRHTCDVLAERHGNHLAAIWTPQHGFWGEQQANMIESPHSRYAPLNIPVFSLYSESREPRAEMLSGIDCLVVDLQDVGTRVYTFIWTVAKCMAVCAKAKIPVIVLDRPNPIGGETIEGPLLERAQTSFVGLASIPMRHALTLGELSQLVNDELNLRADLTVVPMDGWKRSMLFPETGRIWTLPSPNMPRFESALYYPGQVLLEGTNLSEGRGTTIPFEVVGAPYIDPHRLAWEMNSWPYPGVVLRPVRFTPTFDKWRGQSCGGLAWHTDEPSAVRSFVTTLSVMAAVQRLWPQEFAWLPPPYEYETVQMPIDILFGSTRLREQMAHGTITIDSLMSLTAVDAHAWHARTSRYRLYA